MPLEIIPATLALNQLKSNPFANWPHRGGEYNRIEPIAMPAICPEFNIESGVRVFTIGSCFARHVERVLHDRGFDLPALALLKRIPEFQQDGGEALNNYSVASIYNEISWALDPAHPFNPTENFFEAYPGRYIDVHVHRSIRPAALEVVRERRQIITEIYKSITECPLVIITLGLTENWFDSVTKLYLNNRPTRSMFSMGKDRYELHILNFSDVIKYLNLTFDLLSRTRRADTRVLLTVSPVPIAGTHRNMDVAITNCYSKSVLRAAAEEVAASYDFVQYYPSYESVTLSDRDIAWQDDQRHVTAELVKLNVDRMIDAYLFKGDLPKQSELSESEAKLLEAIRYGRAAPRSVVNFLDRHPSFIKTDTEILAAYCDACLAVGRVDECGIALQGLPPAWNPHRLAVLKARWHLESGEPKTAEQICRGLLAEKPPHALLQALLTTLLKANIQTGGPQAGLKVLDRWKATRGKIPYPEPYYLLAVALAKDNQDDDAEAMFEEMLRCWEGPPDGMLLGYAEFLLTRGREDQALQLIERVDERDPATATRLALLSLSLLQDESVGS